MGLIQHYENELLALTIQNDRVGETARWKNPFFLFCMDCRLDVRADEKHWLLDKDDFVVFNKETWVCYEMQGRGIACMMEIRAGASANYLNLAEKEIRCSSFMSGKPVEKVRQFLYRIANLIVDEGKGDEALLRASYYELLYYLHENFLENRSFPDTGRGRDEAARMQQIQFYIREHYNEPITLQDLSEETYLSTAYLSKYIKKKFGANLTDIVTQIRLEHAVDDVRSTKNTFTKIALDHGFSNVASFNRAFEKQYRMLPSEYRRQYAEEKEEQSPGKQPRGKLEKRYRDYFRQIGFESDARKKVVFLEANVQDARVYPRFWNRMIDGCRAELLLRAEMQKHILMLKDELHFQAVRIWDIYSPEMMLYDGDRTHGFNFARLDMVLDFLTGNGLCPYIELGFKPVLLMKSAVDYLVRENREVWFRNTEEYGKFLDQLFRHLLTRYGVEEVNKWYFEQWRDPRLPDLDSYIRVFETLYTRAKYYSPHIHVGGGGFHHENTKDLEEVIKVWKTRYCYPDFVSLYGYPYTHSGVSSDYLDAPSVEEQSRDHGVSRDAEYLKHEVELARRIMRENGFGNIELHLSEWNFMVGSRNALNDSIFKGAYNAKSLLDMVGLVDMAGYWFGSDLNTEYYDTKDLLDGSNGLISKSGIRKPAFYAFDFFERLRPYILSKNEDMMITTNLHDSYSIVCHNYCKPNYRYYQNEGLEVTVRNYREFIDGQNKTIRFRINGMENGTYQLKTRTISEKSGSVLDEWKEMEFLENPTKQDILYLRNICVPRIRISTIKVTNHLLEYDVELSPNEIESIHIYRML